MTTRIDALTEFLNGNGFSAKAWKNSRIYLNGYGRDIKAFIVLDDPVDEFDPTDETDYLYSGAALRVFSNANQSRNWLVNRAKQIKHAIMQALDEVNDENDFRLFGEKVETCESWQEVIL